MALVPAVLDALVGVCRGSSQAALAATATRPRLQVLDGPEPAWPQVEFLVIGLSPEEPSTLAPRTPAGLQATTESADVTCLIRVWSGDTAVKPQRDRAYAILEAVVAELARDPMLGGACSHAEVADSTYIPAQVPDSGCVVDVVFTIRARQF